MLRDAFEAAGLDSPALDARVLLNEVAGVSPTALLMQPHEPLGSERAQNLVEAARRRLRREPVARILGRREFWGLTFELAAETLVPRPDSETMVATALRCLADRDAPLRVLDLGTGSGCLLVALLSELPRAVGLGIDRSWQALATARRNAEQNGVGGRALFALGEWGSGAASAFDLVVANPPYIAADALEGLDPEVRDHDPRAALDGGPDGLACYRGILADAPRLLGTTGRAVLEIGFDQELLVRALVERTGLRVLEAARDLGGHVRALAISADRDVPSLTSVDSSPLARA